jgi:hypothetical protein
MSDIPIFGRASVFIISHALPDPNVLFHNPPSGEPTNKVPLEAKSG